MGRIAPYAAAASAVLIIWHVARDKPSSVVNASPPPVYPATAAAAEAGAQPPAPIATPAAPTPADATLGTHQAEVASTIEVVVGRNDTLDGIFQRLAFDKTDLAAIRNLPGIRQSLDYLKPGDAIKITADHGEIKELTRKISETQTLTVTRQDTGFAATMINHPVEVRVRTATATIGTSLFQGAEAAKISDPIALKLAKVFAWDIDFVLDIRQGDHFTAVYEQIYQNGQYLHDGDVLAAEFVNSGKIYRAVRFENEPGHFSYYSIDGKPMRKAFLRAPVEFTRVSSVFNPNRMHPILNRIRGQWGTDYAAPAGTPIHAAGDGRVSFAGRRGGYGNALVLAHSTSVSTLYGHMSRFARNMRVGAHVSQGDVIGYVGMTGLATGPHLHYEYLMNGVHMNPQTVQLPGAEPLHADALARFRAFEAPLLVTLIPPLKTAPVPALGDGGSAADPRSVAPTPAPSRSSVN